MCTVTNLNLGLNNHASDFMAENYSCCETFIICLKENENGTNTVIYPITEQNNKIRQPTNSNMKLDCCRIHKNMKSVILGKISTLEIRKGNPTNLQYHLDRTDI